MKKIKLNPAKLQLNKEKIANLTQEEMNNANGGQKWSDGCTDGCGIFGSAWNCTKANCSNDCSGGFCPATNTGHPSTGSAF